MRSKLPATQNPRKGPFLHPSTMYTSGFHHSIHWNQILYREASWRFLHFPFATSVLTEPHKLVSSVNLLMVHPIPLSMSLKKFLNNVDPSMDPWGTPLTTGCHLDTELLTITVWIQPPSQFLIHLIVHPSHIPLSKLEVRIFWQTKGHLTRNAPFTLF